MAFVEDPADFLADFGVTVTAGATTGLGILDMPGEYIGPDGRIITTEYVLRAETSKFGTLEYNDSLTVNSESYTVRETPLMVDDGAFCLVLLSKIAAALNSLLLESGDVLLLEDDGFLLLEA